MRHIPAPPPICACAFAATVSTAPPLGEETESRHSLEVEEARRMAAAALFLVESLLQETEDDCFLGAEVA